MVETEVDEYKLDTNQGKKQHTLRVSLINDRVSLIIVNMNNKKEKYYNLIRLDQFRNACEAFDEIQTIKEALSLIKNTIENNHILISEDEEAKNIDIKFNVRIGKKNYPPFVIGLPIDDPEEEQVEQKIKTQTKAQTDVQIPTQTQVANKENDVEVLPTKFDYRGDKEAAAKYGQTTNNTTEYVNPIIKSNIKKPNLILEYIEPILQVHYPDGTTKSTPLPPRIQTADGKKPNINPEQLKSLHEQMTRSFNQSISEYEKDNNRANSVSHKNTSSYSRQTVSSFANNTLRTANSNNISYPINNINILNQKNLTNLNMVRSAIEPHKKIITFNNNLNSIRSARTAFNPNDNERGTDVSTSSKNTIPKDNYSNYKQNLHNSKGMSDYSISSVPNKPLVISGYYGSIPNPTIKNNNSSSNHKNNNYINMNGFEQAPFIQEIPRMINPNQSTNYNLNMFQRGLNKSSSSPSMPTMDKVNHNFYHQNQSLTQYNISQNPNFSYIQNQINNINLRYPYQNLIQSQNPNINQNQYNNRQTFNSVTQDFNMLTRHNSSQTPLVSQSYIAQINQQKISQKRAQEHQGIEAQKNIQIQQKIQEQKSILLMQQRQKMYPNNPLSIGNIQISQQINRKNPHQIPQNNNNKQINKQGQGVKQQLPLTQTQNLRNNPSQQINKFQQKQSQPIERSRNQIKEVQHPLKQSYSQQIIRQKPSLKNQITEQQIALAQMASLQNIKNPNNFNASTVQLNKRFLDSAGNEETQSQYEREEEQIQENDRQEKNCEQPVDQEKQEQNEINEADIFENLYRTEEGYIIFRNGLLCGIIHKFAEITDVVSKIQIMVCAGVKFTLLYRASEHGDRAKVFHEKCDKHQMTLVLVETTKGSRFGGFTTKTWDGNCVKKIDNDAFVFSIDKHKIYDIRKNEYAIGGYPKFGPVFFGCQIRIYDEFFKKGGTTCLRSLNYKTKMDYELNNGEQQYIVKEIEVYDIEVIKM
jgi:hypothetical protein